MEGAGWQEPASTTISTQAPSQVGALAHSPPFTRVVGLPQSSNARHDNAYSKLTVHGCSEVGRQSYASLGGVGSSQSMVHGYPYQLPHTSVLASDHEPNRRIPYTRSVASDCRGREVTGVPSQSQASYLPHLSAHTYTLACLQKREIGHRLLPSVQTLLRLTPAGRGHRTTRVTTPYGFGCGIRPPAWPWGFPPWYGPPPPPGWACSQTSDQPRRSATAAQRHTARPSCSGSGRSVSESGTHLSAPSSAPPARPISRTGAFVSARSTGPYPVCHKDFGRSASGLRYESLP